MKLVVLRAVALSMAFGLSCAVHAQGGPPKVIVEAAQTEEVYDVIEAIGTLRASESVQISANVTETIRRIGFDDGQRVRRGQMLVEFEAGEEGARIAEAQAAVNVARQEFERAQRLFRREALSESEFLARQRDLASAEARLESADAQGRDRVIRAPFDGVVGLRNISVGATVRPGDPIVRIDDITVLNLDFPVSATRLNALQPGQQVVAVASALPGETFTGKITTIDSFVDPGTRSVMVRAVIPNPKGRLRPGLLMTVEVKSTPRRSVVINEGAVIPFGGRMSVYVVRTDGETSKVEQRPVRQGTRRDGKVEIVSGLEAGEHVITHGTMKARPGRPVTPVLADGRNGSVLAQFLQRSGS